MPSTYTLNNGIELIATGEQSGTWGDTTNTNLSLLDTALDGQVTVTLPSAGTSGSPNTLAIADGSASDGRNRMVIFNDGGDLGATAYVQLTPNDAEKIIYIRNDLAGSRSIILFQGTYNASNDYEVPAGTTAVVYFDGAGSGAVAANVFNNAYFDSLRLGGVSVTAIIDDDTMATAAATNIPTAESVKDYVNAQVGANNELSEVLANGNTTGGTDIAVSAGDDITFTDTSKAIFGAGSDLQIYHDGANSYIAENGTGNLRILGDQVIIANSANNEFKAVFNSDGAVELKYDNATKIATVSTGIEVDNRVGIGISPLYPLHVFDNNADRDMDINGAGQLHIDGNGYAFGIALNLTGANIYTNSASRAVILGTDETERLRVAGNGDITFYDTSGNASFVYDESAGSVFNEQGDNKDFRVESDSDTHALFVDASSNRVGIGTSAPSAPLSVTYGGGAVGAQITGNASYAQMQLTAAGANTNAYFTFGANGTGKGIIQRNAVDVMAIDSSGNIGIGTISPSSKLDVTGNAEFESGKIIINEVTGGDAYSEIRKTNGGSNFAIVSPEALYLLVDSDNNQTNRGVVIGHDAAAPGSATSLAVIAENGTVFNEPGADVDFRVESATSSHALFVDAGLNRVGINQSNPGYIVEVVQGGNSNLDGVALRPANETQTAIYSFLGMRNTYYTQFTVDSNNTGNSNYNYFQFFSGTEDVNGELLFLGDTVTHFNNGGHDRDFRVESDTNANALFVDASANKVIVGGTSYYGGTPAIFGVNGHMDIGTTFGNAWSLAFAASQTVGSMGTITSKISGFSTMSAIQFYANNVTGGSQAASINFYTTNSATQRNTGRFINEGAFQVSNDGTYRTWSGNITGNQFINNQQNMVTLTGDATSTAFTSQVLRTLCNRSQNAGYHFLTCTSGNLGDDEFRLRGDGQAYADGSWNGGGADYAEYFETTTGAAIPRGTTVVLEGNKVRAATADDPASAIIGVIRPKEDGKISAMVGNTAWARWAEKYLTDDFGVYLMEDHNVIEWEEEYLDDEGETRKKSHSYESHNIPDGITVPEDATIRTHDAHGKKFQHRQLNPDYDPTLEYVSREDRDEWVIVGLLGQVRILSGQPVGERWTKMKDISATVEEWFIR